MAASEGRLRRAGQGGIDAVSIVTPNHLHAPIAKAFLSEGIHVICDKPLAVSLVQALELQTLARQSRSEEHTSELQSLMRISYAFFCLKKKTTIIINQHL